MHPLVFFLTRRSTADTLAEAELDRDRRWAAAISRRAAMNFPGASHAEEQHAAIPQPAGRHRSRTSPIGCTV